MFRDAFRFPFGLTASILLLLLVAIIAGTTQSCSQRAVKHAAGMSYAIARL